MLFWFRKLSVDFWRFRVFVFCHRAHSETRKLRKNFYKFIFRGIKTIYLIWYTFVSILCAQETTLKICSNLSRRTYHLNLEVAFLLLKPKLYLDNKVIRVSFNHLLRAVTARSTLFEKRNAFFSTKASKNTCRLGACSVLNALNLQK